FLIGLHYARAAEGPPMKANMILRGGLLAGIHLLLLVAAAVGMFWGLRAYPHLLPFEGSEESIFTLALISGGAFASSNLSIAQHMAQRIKQQSLKEILFALSGFTEALSMLVMGIGLFVWSPSAAPIKPGAGSAEIVTRTIGNPLAAIIIGLILALCVRLLIGSQERKSVAARLALLGLVTLGTGAALGVRASEAFVGLSFGMILSFFYRHKDLLDTELRATEWPVQMAAYFFVGLFLELKLTTVLFGLSLGALRLLLKGVSLALLNRGGSAKLPLASVSSFSSVALILVLSLDLNAGAGSEAEIGTRFILSSFAVAVAATDLLTVMFFAVRQQSGKPERVNVRS
ncbi:MAG: hypothetical protein AB7P49_17965, partial [Bdellovibrionales bacterium]